ncbi:HD domain-containing protein 2 [Auxenochlorella protothecoides]|uniref:5'-deoxynucleotidase n=1 Tax=Auxenochlorella protothecoides TaxID=3075 RepID=A0A087SMK1_AUXPR|nr:HD domain-containing protein 2 [Auxenochlorella protothecoides]KFM26955.1 HD domain-containing protein 2 [Auxenochlorella protothecoides]RMZ56696.1 hypothetical protein APUTEX25_002785 [Auxenochlorella protothecoides]|eukprot:RMZ56696.1 hypothetical protein APUTEX25_002785 [Auxenochlorella protothecoides]
MFDGEASTPGPSPRNAIDFLTVVQQLKLTKRTGWVKRGVKGPESIADHMYRMGVMSLLLSGTGYDYNRCMRLALVHDIAESLVGDITPTCGVSDEEKHALESAGIQKLKAMLGGGPAADEMEELWREYEAGESTEAALVKDFDKLEMILQAQEYEAGQGMVLQEFFDSTAGKWRTGLGRTWAAEIASRRPGAAAQED